MDRHLVAVEVGVERRTHQRVDLDRAALDQDRLERLNTEAVQRWSAVQQDRVILNDLLEHIPDLGSHALDDALGALDVVSQPLFDQLAHDERLEQLQRHALGQTALVQLQRRADHDDRAARIVDALAQQVLAEAALLALEHVRQALELVVARAADGPPASTVVDQRVDRLLEHALFVADDDLGSLKFQKALEAVVAVDDAPVQVVQIGGREATTVQLHHRPQIRRQDGQRGHDHPLRPIAALAERLDHAQALGGLLALLTAGRVRLGAQLGAQLVERDVAQEIPDRFGAHARAEHAPGHVLELAVLHLGERVARLDRLELLDARLGAGPQLGVAARLVHDLLRLLLNLVAQFVDL